MKKVRSFASFLLIFSAFFIYFIHQNDHNHVINADKSHLEHEIIEVPEGYKAPDLDVIVKQDQTGTWLLEIQTANFTFAPSKVGNDQPSFNEGHAHLYINGKKIKRLYGKYYNLGRLDLGESEIRVTLNANNHSVLVTKAGMIEDRVVVNVTQGG